MLNTNDSSIIFKSITLQQKAQDRKVFDEFANRENLTTCDSARGHLVKENLLEQFASSITDNANDVCEFSKAIMTGKSSDHKLGRINGLGMKLGGALVAGALAGSKSTTNKKLMELFGFGTFFSVMSLWPKVAIDLPTQLRFGFNPHQKYVDSTGTKKDFFQDNQYLPFDMWPKEDLDKIADKMGVPKDLKDREEYTKEKMRTIALQDNTLWMLTAGFSTPLLTSLICNRIEEGLKVPVANANLKKLAGQSENTQELINKAIANTKVFAKQDETFAQITDTLKQGKMPENLAETLGDVFDITKHSNNQEIMTGFKRNGENIAKDLVTRIFPASSDITNTGFVEALVGDEGEEAVQEAKELFIKAGQNASKNGKKPTVRAIIDNVNSLIDNDFDKFQNRKWIDKISEGFDGLSDDLKTLANTKAGYSKETLEQGADTLERVYTSYIKPAQAQINVFGKQINGLNNISGEEYNKVLKTLVKELKLSDAEIKAISQADESYGGVIQTILADKLKEIAGDENRYEKVVNTITKQQNKIEEVSLKNGNKVSIRGVFDSLADKVSENFKGLSKEMTSESDSVLNGSLLQKTFEGGLTKQEVENAGANVVSVKSTITKLLNSLELEKRISDGSLLQDWSKYAAQNGLDGKISADKLEDFYQTCRKISWQSSYSDAMNKYFVTGNGDFFKAMTDTLFAKTSNSNALNDWQQVAKSISNESGCVPNPALEIKLNNAVDKAFNQIKNEYCTKHNISTDELENNCKDVLNMLKKQAMDSVGVQDNYFEEIGKSHSVKFADFGESLLGAVKKQVNSLSENRTWLKKFGGMTLALTGATLISQLFFGKVKDSHLYEKKQNQTDTFENGK